MALPPRSQPLPWHPEAYAPTARWTMAAVGALRWHDHPQCPLIPPPLGSPLLADPSFLPPGQTPDERWHLFASSRWGLHHHVSDDGVSWVRQDPPVLRGVRGAFLFQDQGRYHLIYEQATHLLPWRPRQSHIEIRNSIDLRAWSPPRVLLRPSLPWHRHGQTEALCHPGLVRVGDRLILSYSAGLTRLEDRELETTRHIGLAEGRNLDGPFTPFPAPLLSPSERDAPTRPGAGSLRVMPVEDGFVAFQSALARDAQGTCTSTIHLLGSEDGRQFQPLGSSPVQLASDRWSERWVGGLDVRPVGGALRLYYAAQGDAPRKGATTGVGLALGS